MQYTYMYGLDMVTFVLIYAIHSVYYSHTILEQFFFLMAILYSHVCTKFYLTFSLHSGQRLRLYILLAVVNLRTIAYSERGDILASLAYFECKSQVYTQCRDWCWARKYTPSISLLSPHEINTKIYLPPVPKYQYGSIARKTTHLKQRI